MTGAIKIAPSILAADFARLGEEIAEAQQAGADEIHADVMDGHFVPNITIGPVVVKSIRRVTTVPLVVHLMISDADRYLEPFARAGADALVVHIEACPQIHHTIQRIHDMGLRAGVAISPDTPISAIEEIAPGVESVLVMTVYPGFGGQAFIEHSPDRIRQARNLLDRVNPGADLAVDGGIEPARTAGEVVAAGANVLIAGTSVFRTPGGIRAAIASLKQAAVKARSAGN